MISQHSREEQLMLNFIHSLNSGKLNKNNNCLKLTIRSLQTYIKFSFRY